MSEIDYSKAHITLADGTVIQVLGDDGEYDDDATAQAVMEYMEENNGS